MKIYITHYGLKPEAYIDQAHLDRLAASARLDELRAWSEALKGRKFDTLTEDEQDLRSADRFWIEEVEAPEIQTLHNLVAELKRSLDWAAKWMQKTGKLLDEAEELKEAGQHRRARSRMRKAKEILELTNEINRLKGRTE